MNEQEHRVATLHRVLDDERACRAQESARLRESAEYWQEAFGKAENQIAALKKQLSMAEAHIKELNIKKGTLMEVIEAFVR